ncbi:hypothetical protein CA13_72590 [Planctomycetes bacterium CA13]|uniref:Uncharacterized protein n=1 Tax=Novipirellula herctigrandis TaxID=2527986 RepID=A0A5C5YPT2_9BACT|nr:hypothetical protein CA13_72590 [Planctomycetes bacterium CA13]
MVRFAGDTDNILLGATIRSDCGVKVSRKFALPSEGPYNRVTKL